MIKFFNKHSRLIVLMPLIVLLYNCKSKTINCEIETDQGNILVKLYPNKAPNTVANFLRYVDANKYENSSFFRVCNDRNESDRTYPIKVIQGGLDENVDGFPPINIETTKVTSLKHVNGTISMARLEPNTATDSFFICIGNQPELDFNGKRNPDGQGFAAFGKVTKGMDVVLAIQKMKDTLQYLVNPVLIESIKRIK